VFLRYSLAWIPTVILGIANAAIRQTVYARYVSELAAHQISTLTLCILYGIYVWVVVGFLKLQSPGQAISVGLLWMVLTILFEFGLGHYVLGDSWGKLLHAYNILEGRVWGLFILWVALAPYLFYRIKA
jgi:nitrate/nitrite-specific signal transduction histidine kinase